MFENHVSELGVFFSFYQRFSLAIDVMLVEQNRILTGCVAAHLKELSQIAPRPIRSVFTTVQYILWIKTCATRSILMTTDVPYII